MYTYHSNYNIYTQNTYLTYIKKSLIHLHSKCCIVRNYNKHLNKFYISYMNKCDSKYLLKVTHSFTLKISLKSHSIIYTQNVE